MDETDVIDWFAEVNYQAMILMNQAWWPAWCIIFFLGGLIGMSPLKTHYTHNFFEISAVYIRRATLIISFCVLSIPFVLAYIYSMTSNQSNSENIFLSWFLDLAQQNWFKPILSVLAGAIIRLLFNRYCMTALSNFYRSLTKKLSSDKPSDIKSEQSKYKALDYLPEKHYDQRKGMFVGLSEKKKPIYIPNDTWYETNMKIVGPTRFGKGVLLGAIMDQIVMNGDTLFYIDPKHDKYAPHIMYQACKRAGRKFHYLSLHDEEIGSWAPFSGGSTLDAFSRLQAALGLEMTGEPKTDFYKRQEVKTLDKVFASTRRVEGLLSEIKGTDSHTAEAELERWSNRKSLCPRNSHGFSIERAIEENAVVYIRGDLDDDIINTATKIFITELVQESRRLAKEGRKHKHLTAIVDEVAFLVSKELKNAMATIVGFGVNFILAYQSEEDLLNVDDININGKALQHSIDVNSQIKAIYGGSNVETAEWAAKLSGTTQKTVTKFEKTNTKAGGGEAWEHNRTVGSLEENLIHPNVILTLPRRVCVFVQPGRLLEPLFTAFVPVANMSELFEYLKSKMQSKESISHEKSESSSDGKSKKNTEKNKRRRQQQKEKKKMLQTESPSISHEKSKVIEKTRQNDNQLNQGFDSETEEVEAFTECSQ